ncbi:MAG: hypoxanthine phosphoribosyltransferase [Chloroflexi bacterium]|nr:hypoxanthine phosphoribosyltransferase [Chloroflexota bacterium]
MREDIARVVIGERDLGQRIRELGQQIAADYAGESPVLIGVLKGAVLFLVDLMREIDLPVELDFIAISSYGGATQSSGVVRITKDLDSSVEGRHLIVVEDIVDTGLTLRYLVENLASRHPASLRVCALLNKRKVRKADLRLDYVGFEIPDEFVVGYGLDYAEQYRNLPFIGVLRRETDS